MGGQLTSPFFAPQAAPASLIWPCARSPLSHRCRLSPLSRLSKMSAPGAFPRELSPIKMGLPSFSATLTSTDTLPTSTECRRTRTEPGRMLCKESHRYLTWPWGLAASTAWSSQQTSERESIAPQQFLVDSCRLSLP
ncbi:hypothetical protein B0T18DRAFT_44750 [Schizothecium vesticola]|uniref:Uncharacterized protein n=1 Tax=Schizothecium vesticola TaxID=314040 RepID=A0AA40FBJ9_9PEZI|nr:hypothetical protein B0T18DRAFT_44750 [Schizothecium vesticola]